MARRHDRAVTAFLITDARLVRFRGPDQDGVRFVTTSLVGVRFLYAIDATITGTSLCERRVEGVKGARLA